MGSSILEDGWISKIKHNVKSRTKEVTAMAEEAILKREHNNAREGQVLLPKGASKREKKYH